MKSELEMEDKVGNEETIRFGGKLCDEPVFLVSRGLSGKAYEFF